MKWPVTIIKILTDVLTMRGLTIEQKANLTRPVINVWTRNEEGKEMKADFPDKENKHGKKAAE